MKTKQLRITGVQQEYCRTKRTRKLGVITRGYMVLDSTVADAPLTRGDREKGDESTGCLGHGEKGVRAKLYRGLAFSVAEAGVVP